ncbi:coilin-like [Gossypium australe]|uniref:Coilin-like n=1 Tax=Gossypium australe TaxID=47621 RepID=A0A5B6UWC4_9ROSI|nr:coilin-like [Gossypium australe]
MLRGCVVDFSGNCEEHFSLSEFAYNNIFQLSIQMDPCEALYGRKCRTPLCWTKLGEKRYWVSSWKKVLRFRHKGKLSPRFIGPYRILNRRYHSNPSHVVLIYEVEVRPGLSYEEMLVQILDYEVKILRKKQFLQ